MQSLCNGIRPAFLTLITTIIVAAVLAACGGGPKAEGPTGAQAPAVTQTTQSTAAGDDHGSDIDDATPAEIEVPIAGVIGEFDDKDLFRFTTEGRYFYQIDLEMDTLSNASMKLLDSVGEALPRAESNSPDGLPLQLVSTTSEPGDYFVQVSALFQVRGAPSDNPDSGLGSYTLNITRSEFVDDHGDVAESATLIPVGATIEGSIDVSREVDYFRLTVEEQGHYQIYVSIGALDTDDVALTIQRKDNETGYWTTSDVYAYFTDDGPDCEAPHTNCIDLQPGDHYFAISSISTGNYTLTITETEGE